MLISDEYCRNDGINGKVLLSAFGIHTGGGLVLLNALIKGLNGSLKAASLDLRCNLDTSLVSSDVRIEYVRRSFAARLFALSRLGRMTLHGDTLLCFNSLPPLMRSKGRVIVFVHAPHFVGAHRGIRYSLLTTLRIKIERLWYKLGIGNCDEIWVQTVSMQKAMSSQHPLAVIKVKPLVDDDLAVRLSMPSAVVQRHPVDAAQFTFFYPADAVGHKNHENLLKAWEILAEEKRKPKLLLTLQPSEMEQLKKRAKLSSDMAISLISLGWLPRGDVLKQIKKSSALIFPSRAETFGLPMLEARVLGVPVIASERDFVRDVCRPLQTFDPDSPRSIAMAVIRFMDGECSLAAEYYSAKQFARDIVL